MKAAEADPSRREGVPVIYSETPFLVRALPIGAAHWHRFQGHVLTQGDAYSSRILS